MKAKASPYQHIEPSRMQLLDEVKDLTARLKQMRQLLGAAYRFKEHYKRRAAERPKCYACDEYAVGARDRRPEGGRLELACARHSEGAR